MPSCSTWWKSSLHIDHIVWVELWVSFAPHDNHDDAWKWELWISLMNKKNVAGVNDVSNKNIFTSTALIQWLSLSASIILLTRVFFFAICQVATRVSRNVWSHANHHDNDVPFPYNEWRRWVNLDSTDQWLYIWQLKKSPGCWLNTSKQHTLLGYKATPNGKNETLIFIQISVQFFIRR